MKKIIYYVTITLLFLMLYRCTPDQIFNEIDIDITSDSIPVIKTQPIHYDTIFKPIFVHNTDTIIKPIVTIHNDTSIVTIFYAINYTITQPTCNISTGSVTFKGLPSVWSIPVFSITGTDSTKTVNELQPGIYNVVINISGYITPTIVIVINSAPITPTPPIIGKVSQPTQNEWHGSVELSGLPELGEWSLTKYPQKTSVTGTGVNRTVINLDPKGEPDMKCYSTTYWFTVTNSEGCTSEKSADIIIKSFN